MKKLKFGILFLVLIALFTFTAFAKTHRDDIVVIDTIEYTLEEEDKLIAELYVEEDGIYTIKVLSLSTVEGVRPVISLSVLQGNDAVIDYTADSRYITDDGFEFLACLKTGEYKLEIQNASTFGDVSFVIETDFSQNKNIEDFGGSTFEGAMEISLGTKYFGGVSMEDEMDFFVFEMPYDGYALVQMYSPEAKYFYLYDADKNEIGRIDVSIDDENLIYELRAGLKSGRYYIGVAPLKDYCKPIYSLEILAKSDDGFEHEYNNEKEHAMPIEFGKEYQGNLFGAEDEDVFVFTLPEETGVKIDFTDTVVSKKGRYSIWFTDGNNVLYESDECGRETIALNLGKGTYYFNVGGLGESRVTSIGYKLKVTTDKNLAICPPEVEAGEDENESLPENILQFEDVEETDWYYDELLAAKSSGLIQGVGENKYNPKGNVTVAEVIAMAARIRNSIGGANTQLSTSPVGKWYNSYITFAVNSGIIKRDDFENYDEYATRAEIAYVFSNLFGDIETTQNTIIPDVDEGTRYCDSIHKLYALGILKGDDENGTFYPERNLTRAEAAVILLRVYNAI